MKDHSLRNYLIFAFALAWPLQGLASWFALRGQPLAFRWLMLVVMFAPFAATLIAKIPLRGMGWTPQLKGKWPWYLAAWFGPAVLTALGAALYYVIFPARFDTSGALYLKQTVEALGISEAEARAMLEAQGIPWKLLLVISAAQSLTYAPFINGIAAVGEEVGWRGAMYPRLKERFGAVKGRVLGGVIWGAWHWPVMLLAGYEYGLEYWGAPVLGMLLFCLITTGMGILLDLVYEKTGCIWAPALGHGAINAAAALPILFLDPAYADRMTVGPATNGIVGGLPLILLALFVLLKPAAPRQGEQNPETA